VSRAFKWHVLWPEDVGGFATSLPRLNGAGQNIAISLAMTFGWLGSPGEYMIYAWAAKWFHAAHRPPAPCVNDTVAFSSIWLMDDGVIPEAAVGWRPWLSAETLEVAMQIVCGAHAVNDDKKDEEG